MNVGEDYRIGRSFIMGEEVRALNTKVQDPVISAINRWKDIDRVKMNRPMFSMFDIMLVLR